MIERSQYFSILLKAKVLLVTINEQERSESLFCEILLISDILVSCALC